MKHNHWRSHFLLVILRVALALAWQPRIQESRMDGWLPVATG